VTRSIYSRAHEGSYTPPSMRARASVAVALAGGALLGAGCGSQGIQVSSSSPYHRGAVLFREHCSGCHTLSVVGAEGSATKISNRLPTNGPNFNIRKENVEQVLYAIRNGGFSGAIMPENIVVGEDAQAVASFLAQYSGRHSSASSTP
jgi:mono/diheme cytochrome c family protein